MEFVGKNYVRIGNNFISTKTGRRFDATPEGLAALEQDNGVFVRSEAGRAALPAKSRSVPYRIAAERGESDPTGPNPWESAIAVTKAQIQSNGFRDPSREAQLPELEAASKQFADRKAKLLQLPQAPEIVVDSVRAAADLLRARPNKLGERLSNTVADRLYQKANQQDQARLNAAVETARTSDETYLRAVKYLELEIHRFERSVVPPEWIESAKAQLEQVRAGTVTPHEWWHAYQPARVEEQGAYYEKLTTAKKAEIATHEQQLANLPAGDTTPPATVTQ